MPGFPLLGRRADTKPISRQTPAAAETALIVLMTSFSLQEARGGEAVDPGTVGSIPRRFVHTVDT